MLDIKEVSTARQALDIAFVRNTGREFMTGNSSYITVSEQLAWYDEVYKPANKAGYLHAFAGYIATMPVAYGLIALRDEDYWVTGVIHDRYRGQGNGEQLFRHISKYALDGLASRVMLDVYEHNDRALELYGKLGYAVLFKDGNRLVMCLDKENYVEPQPTDI